MNTDTGAALGPKEVGEICVRGYMVMKGYRGNPAATAEMIDADGWLHTGDIGYYDQDGWFYIVDRMKELIKYKGFQVAPSELEHLLLEHPDVSDAAVIGVPDESAGELPRAYVVKRPGAQITEKDIIDFVNGNSFKLNFFIALTFITEMVHSQDKFRLTSNSEEVSSLLKQFLSLPAVKPCAECSKPRQSLWPANFDQSFGGGSVKSVTS